jgi:hypothetical protein
MEAVRLLLDAGADVNGLTGSSWSPLLIAIQNRYYRLAMFLLDRGADPNLANNRGLDTTLHRGGQPQHRGRRVSVASAGHGPSRGDQDTARPRCRRQHAQQAQHVVSHRVHRPVVL